MNEFKRKYFNNVNININNPFAHDKQFHFINSPYLNGGFAHYLISIYEYILHYKTLNFLTVNY